MYADGARVFVEVGPRTVLSGLTEKTLAGKPVTIVSTDQPGRNGLVQLCHALARLYSVGVPMRLAPLFAGRANGAVSVAQVLAAGKPVAPSLTTWRVNGARAVPYHAPAKPLASKPVEPLRLTAAPAAQSSPSPVGSNDALTGRPAEPIAAPIPVAAEGGVMGAYQAMMSKFLDTQKSVMFAYLQGGTAAAPTPAPTSRLGEPAPSPVRTLTAEPKPSPAPAVAVEPALVPAHSGWTSQRIADRLVKIVSERTGYPPDMLNMDLDMEADLGIDSIKRVEILGTLQAESILPGKSLDHEMEALAKLKTLRAIVNWISLRATSDTAPASAVSAIATVTSPANSETVKEAVIRRTIAVVDAPLQTKQRSNLSGVVLLVDDDSQLACDLSAALTSRGIESATLAVAGWNDRAATLASLAAIRSQYNPIGAVVCLGPAAGTVSDSALLNPVSSRAELLGLFTVIQALERDVREGKARLLVVRRMDGALGEASDSTAFNPADGGACGLVKSVAREWTDVQCRVLDIGSTASTARAVSDIIAELDCNDGLVEVGRLGGKRVALGVSESTLATMRSPLSLNRGDVVLITGGARGITAEIALELAERFQCRLVLCGRSPLPEDHEDPATASLTGMKALKAAVRARIESAGGTPTPASIECAYAKLLRDRDIRATLGAIRAAGASVEYHIVDVADAASFGALIDALYTRLGRLDGVIHGAGVTEDKFLADKTVESFDRVLRPKIDGAFTLAARLRLDALKFLTFFSSVTARYGNRGQSDYAAANEVLNKLARWLNHRCQARVTALNWGPWESTGGMVSPELAKQFAKAGVQMISRPAGRRLFVDEILFGKKADAEVIFGGPLTGGDALQPASRAVPGDSPVWPLLNCRSRVTRTADGGTEVSRELDPGFDLYLLDHQLDGKPVMPMVVGLELLGEVAASTVAAELQIASVRDLRVLRGITIEQGPRTITVSASASKPVDGGIQIDLRAKTDTERPTLSYTAVAHLARELPPAPRRDSWELIEPRAFSMSIEEAYEQWLFHGPLFAGIVEVERIGENGIIGRLSPSSPSRCLAETSPNVRWIMDPVVLDSGLQLLILWARTYRDATPLPSRFGAFHRFGDLSAGEVRCEARVRPAAENNPVVHSDLFFYDLQGRLLGLLEDMEFACSKALNRLGQKRAESAGT
jgi:NAD(P)-dependent dehydrogenase (short-subunit alcohol dehydrogenase family)/acyl carrier protein